jgi:hypothetical protein
LLAQAIAANLRVDFRLRHVDNGRIAERLGYERNARPQLMPSSPGVLVDDARRARRCGIAGDGDAAI